MKSFLTASLMLALTSTQGLAQQNVACGDRGEYSLRLQEKYGEQLQSVGIDHEGRLLELFASIETGTWTILLSVNEQISCVVAVGNSYTQVEKIVTPDEQL